MNVRTEWHKGPDFAEIAETLAIETTQIMGASNPQLDTVHVLYTPEGSSLDNPTILSVTLKRDRDGILQRASLPVEQVGLWQRIVADIEGKLA